MHPHASDLPCVVQPHVLPGLASIGGFVHTIPVRDVPTNWRLTHADVHDVGIGLRNADRSDRPGLEVLIGDRLPVNTTVGSLPYAAAGRPKIEDALL